MPVLKQVKRRPNQELHKLTRVGKLFVAGIITDHARFHRPRDHQGRILNVHEPTELHGPRDEAGTGRLLGVAERRAPIGRVAEEL